MNKLYEAIDNLDSFTLKENYGDKRDYSIDIELYFDKWMRKYIHGIAESIVQFLVGQITVDREDTRTKEGKAFKYTVTYDSSFVGDSLIPFTLDIHENKDKFGLFINKLIPALQCTKITANNDFSTTWEFIQQVEMPDFGAEFDNVK